MRFLIRHRQAREASILADARGFDLLRLGTAGSGEDVVALTLRLLRSTGTSSAPALRASIERAFPISFVGSHPVRAEVPGIRPFGRRSAALISSSQRAVPLRRARNRNTTVVSSAGATSSSDGSRTMRRSA